MDRATEFGFVEARVGRPHMHRDWQIVSHTILVDRFHSRVIQGDPIVNRPVLHPLEAEVLTS